MKTIQTVLLFFATAPALLQPAKPDVGTPNPPTLVVLASGQKDGSRKCRHGLPKESELRNFGVFEVKICKARIGQNPSRPETDVHIPSRAIVKFTAGKDMRKAALKLSAP